MPRVSALPGAVAAVLVIAAATWWLASIALQLGSGLDDVTALSARAATVLVLSQWLSIALLTPLALSGTSQAAPRSWNLLAVSAPLWPLLALLWLTSELPLVPLLASQLGAVLLALVVTLLVRFVGKLRLDRELRHLAGVAIGVLAAGLIWLSRAALAAWLLP